jgi:hypothetical protein
MPVRAMCALPSGAFAVSAAAGERHAAVWDTGRGKRGKKQASAAVSLSMEAPAVQLDACAAAASSSGGAANGAPSASTSAFYVAAVSETGEAYVWAVQPAAT